MTYPTGEAPNINYRKYNYGKTGQFALAPDFIGKINYGNDGHLQELWMQKKVRIISGIFWTLMGKNPLMEKSDADTASFYIFPYPVGDHNYNYNINFLNILILKFKI